MDTLFLGEHSESSRIPVSGVCISQTFKDVLCTYAIGAKSNVSCEPYPSLFVSNNVFSSIL